MTLTYEQHATQARALARAAGMHDCIHYADGRTRRADALFEELRTFGMVPESIGLLADGRMAVTGRKPLQTEIILGLAELKSGG